LQMCCWLYIWSIINALPRSHMCALSHPRHRRKSRGFLYRQKATYVYKSTYVE
jgi:hypothetical protein